MTAATGAYGGAVLARVRDDAADATIGLGRRLLQKVFGTRREGEPLPGPLSAVTDKPGDKAATAVLEDAIRAALTASPHLLAEVADLLSAGRVALTVPGVGAVGAQDLSGTVVTGGRGVLVGESGNQRNVRAQIYVEQQEMLAPSAVPQPGQVTITEHVHNLPRPPAKVFTGRGTALNRLAGALDSGQAAVVSQVVYGLGGVGKSELALQHARARQADYSLIWWVTADSPAGIDAGLAALAARLCPPIAVAGTTGDAAGWAMGWLQCHDRWLLILDNVEEPAHVGPLMGQLNSGHILITTRRDTHWQDIAEPVRLDVLDPDPAAAVVTARTGFNSPRDRADAAAIAEELGYLPLALDHAAAYITEARVTPAAYLVKLREHPAAMHGATATGDAQRTIARLWDINIQAIATRDLQAVRLLQIVACYAPDGVPRPIIGCTAPAADTDGQLGMLASYSLITLTPDTVSMHRLLQAVILGLPDDPRHMSEVPADIALCWLDQAMPDPSRGNVAAWPLLRALLPHAVALAGRYPAGSQPAPLARVCRRVGVFQSSQGDYPQAIAQFQSALQIDERIHGPASPYSLQSRSNLAAAYYEAGRLDEAIDLLEQTFTETERALGPDHTDTLMCCNNLAMAYRAAGRLTEAIGLLERSRTGFEHQPGNDAHAYTFSCRDDLAAAYQEAGRLAEATDLLEETLIQSEQALGAAHPDTLLGRNNLAMAYRAAGRLAEAVDLLEQTFTDREQVLGPAHPDTFTTRCNLALAYQDAGRLAEAIPLYEQTCTGLEQLLGPTHPNTLISRSNLAVAYQEAGRLAEAIDLLSQILSESDHALGPTHPHTLTTRGNLAMAYRAAGRLMEAVDLLEQTLTDREHVLGPTHPDTLITRSNVALAHQDAGRQDLAIPLYERAFADAQQALGPAHPITATIRGNLAAAYQASGRNADAAALRASALPAE